MNLMRLAPDSFSRSTAAIAEWAVASIGSQTMHVAVGDVLRDLEVVLDRLQRARVAIEADMAHAGERHEIEHALGEAEAGAQDRHDHQLLAVEQRRIHRLDRRLDPRLHQRQVARGVVAQQQPDLAQQAAEVRARRLPCRASW